MIHQNQEEINDMEVFVRMANEHSLDVSKKRSKYDILKEEIIKRMINGEPKKETWHKKFIKNINKDNKSEKYYIKSSNKETAGTVEITTELKRKIILKNNNPIFIIYRGNNDYIKNDEKNKILEHDVDLNTLRSRARYQEDFKEAYGIYQDSKEIIDDAKNIFQSIENKDYAVVDEFITYNMASLIKMDEDKEMPEKEKREAYTQLQVLYRHVMNIKDALNKPNVNKPVLQKDLDVTYRQICQILINLETEKNIETNITKR